MYVIGIDIGTGSTKAIALEDTGKVLITSHVSYPTFNELPGVSEQDPEVIWQAFVTCITRITTGLPTAPAAVSISSAMHSLICADDQGTALSRMITWADNRSSEVASRLKNSSHGKTLYEETGTPIHAMSPLSKILWLKEDNQALFRSTKKFISIKEYVWFKLFKTFEVDYSIASATGLFNIASCTWHDDALKIAGITTEHLSVPVNTNWLRESISPEISELLKIKGSIKFIIGGSDGCLANVGSFATDPGIAALTIGTSGAVRVAGKSPVLNFSYMPFNYRLDEKTFISGGPINNGGFALRWYAESLLKMKLTNQYQYSKLLTALEIISPGCNGLIFLPYLLGERAPIWNSESCGTFFGITAQHTQQHFTKAVIEGITFSLYQIAKTLEDGGLEIKEVHVSGGFVRSAPWVQLLANIFGKRVCLMNIDDASAIGAALIAMKTLGIQNKVGESAIQSARIFEPHLAEHVLYKTKFFPLYEHLYKALILEMKIFHENKLES
jgi:gluconokinase